MRKVLISSLIIALLSAGWCPSAEAACGRGLFRPFGGRGIPVLRRLRGRGIGQTNYGGCSSGGCAPAGGCVGGSCSR